MEKKLLNLEFAFERGVNFEARTIIINEDIEEGAFSWLDAALTEMEHLNSRKTVTLKINTYGGLLYETNALIGRIHSSTCRIVTEGHGKIMSAGLLILACGDKRKMSKYAMGMHHAASYGHDHEKVIAHEDYLRQMQKEENQRFDMFEEFTHTSAEKWKELAGYKDEYLTPDQCLALGVIDEIF